MTVNQQHEHAPTSNGARERILLRREDTVNGNASLTLIELPAGGRYEVPAGDEEICYYLLSGRGSLAFIRQEHESRWVIDPDTAAWVAAGIPHALVNAGEGPFRCLAARCRSSNVGTRGWRIAPRATWPVHELVGFVSRTIFSPADLTAAGASRTIGVDLETLTPSSVLPTHTHEEEILYLLRGKGFVRTAEGDVPVEPGSVVYTGPFVPHSVHNTEDDNFQYLVWEFRP